MPVWWNRTELAGRPLDRLTWRHSWYYFGGPPFCLCQFQYDNQEIDYVDILVVRTVWM